LIAARVHIIAKPLVHLVVAEIGYIEAVRGKPTEYEYG